MNLDARIDLKIDEKKSQTFLLKFCITTPQEIYMHNHI